MAIVAPAPQFGIAEIAGERKIRSRTVNRRFTQIEVIECGPHDHVGPQGPHSFFDMLDFLRQPFLLLHQVVHVVDIHKPFFSAVFFVLAVGTAALGAIVLGGGHHCAAIFAFKFKIPVEVILVIGYVMNRLQAGFLSAQENDAEEYTSCDDCAEKHSNVCEF